MMVGEVDGKGAYAALKIGSWKLPNCEESPNGLSVSKNERWGAVFGRLYKKSRVMRALKPGGLCRRESVKGGGRDALNGVWERRRKQRQRPLFSAAFPQLLSDQ